MAFKFDRDFPEDTLVVDTTSTGDWPSLSPFNLGPVIVEPFKRQYHVSRNVENAWQFSKCYEEHDDNLPGKWLRWAKTGWDDNKAHRYPMGKGVKPLYSVHRGGRISYTDARSKIYGPAYTRSVITTNAFMSLHRANMRGVDIALLDYDGYRTDDDFDTILNNPDKIMGHAFWLKRALEAYGG